MMASKTRRPKNPKSRRRMRPAGAERDDGSKSLGSGLDEIGFQPLGRRIFVVKREAPDDSHSRGHPTSGGARRPFAEVTPADDPLAYDTSDPDYARKVAERALSRADEDLVLKEVDAALRRWKLRE